jgi:hypothetical protein
VTVEDPVTKLSPPIMFTSHVDTVHAPLAATRQQVILRNGYFCKNDNQPLGADDAAGNWLMLNMIHHGVPGIYAFFRGEERGGIGSTFCAKDMPHMFKGIECAIAFDRKNVKSIITHQHGGRGCSDEFGRSLARVLNRASGDKFQYGLDSTGVYTDTAEFFDLIPNCTNVSVGYYNEHTKNEKLDKRHIEDMRDALLKADWSALDFTPKRPDPPITYGRQTYGMSDLARDLRRQESGEIQTNQRLFEDYEPDWKAGDIADMLFDHAECMPNVELRDACLDLAQRIFKRIEG